MDEFGMDLNEGVDFVLATAEHLSHSFALAERASGVRTDPLLFAAATIVSFGMVVTTAAPADVASSVAEASAELTAILMAATAQRVEDEGRLFDELNGNG